MKCTAPCVPACERDATHVLSNRATCSVLGHNCAEHALPLTRGPDPAYAAEPLEPEAAA
jgi:hypothetical protein